MKLLLVILAILAVPGGPTTHDAPNENDLKRQRQQARAVSLIEQVGSEAALWDDKRRQSDKAELKSIILTVAHKHDPKLAHKLADQLAGQQPEPKKDRGAFDDRTARSEQLLWLAQQALETNPRLAFNLAQRSLAEGLSFTLQNLMTGLRKKDVELSNL